MSRLVARLQDSLLRGPGERPVLYFLAGIMIPPQARIDGASEVAIFFRVMLPLAMPAVTTVSIIYFVWIFHDFMWPLVYLNNNEVRTVTLGMMKFQGQYSSATTLKTAALTRATLPPILVLLLFRKRIQGGLVDGCGM